jgi:Uma2 family endonuclease
MQTVSQMTLQELAMMQVNKKLIMQGISWDFYEQLLKDFEGSNALHFAFDNGILEVEVPQFEHESANRVLQNLVTTICLEKEIDFVNAGSTTFRKRTKAKGVEPDTAFYIQNESEVRGKSNIDLQTEPAPDLVIEVDITSPSLNKMPIYASLGVPEVWLYKGEKVEFYKLADEKYLKTQNSIALPKLSSEKATEFLQKGLTQSSTKWIKEVRNWANEQ